MRLWGIDPLSSWSPSKKRGRKNKEKRNGGVGIQPKVSKLININKKFNMRLSVSQGIQNRVPFPIPY